MSRKKDFYDDGRTIAEMNIEGMPFYDDKEKRRRAGMAEDKQKPELSDREVRQVALSGMLAGLLIGSVFVIAGAIFIAILCIFG